MSSRFWVLSGARLRGTLRWKTWVRGTRNQEAKWGRQKSRLRRAGQAGEEGEEEAGGEGGDWAKSEAGTHGALGFPSQEWP